MKIDLNKPVFAKLLFSKSSDRCEDCIFNMCKTCLPCSEGHWKIEEVFPQSETAFDMQQIQDSVDTKMKQFKSETQQIKEEVNEEPKYFY